jgi:hypothetical protein
MGGQFDESNENKRKQGMKHYKKHIKRGRASTTRSSTHTAAVAGAYEHMNMSHGCSHQHSFVSAQRRFNGG